MSLPAPAAAREYTQLETTDDLIRWLTYHPSLQTPIPLKEGVAQLANVWKNQGEWPKKQNKTKQC